MELMQAISQRRAVRHYTDVMVHRAMVMDLLNAATMAPSAMNQQPWSFAIIRGRRRLEGYSERAKAHLLAILPQMLDLHQRADALASHDYNVFHHAGTLVVICAKPALHHPADDCFLAAQNLMLAAQDFGLGTCPIGFVRPWLNQPEIKRELGIPESHMAVVPIVVGFPASTSPPTRRKEPSVVCWLEELPAYRSAGSSAPWTISSEKPPRDAERGAPG